MSDIKLNKLLTPAAEQVLNEVVEDYRNEILAVAAENSSYATGEVREVSVHDIVYGTRKKSELTGARPRKLVDRVLAIYMILGFLIGISGFSFFAVNEFLIDVEFRRQLPVLIGIVGVAVAGLSLLVLQLRREGASLLIWTGEIQKESAEEIVGIYLSVWRNIELTLRNLASSRLGESRAKEPLIRLIGHLKKENSITIDVAEQLNKMLNLRNELVHGRSDTNQEELVLFLNIAKSVSEKLGVSANEVKLRNR